MILHSAKNESRAVIAAFASLCISLSLIAIISTVYAAPKTPKPDAAASSQAFLQVYKVVTSPRCQNCHPAGDAPLQGDDSHVHMQNVKRGKDGHGVSAIRAWRPGSLPSLRGAGMAQSIQADARCTASWF